MIWEFKPSSVKDNMIKNFLVKIPSLVKNLILENFISFLLLLIHSVLIFSIMVSTQSLK